MEKTDTQHKDMCTDEVQTSQDDVIESQAQESQESPKDSIADQLMRITADFANYKRRVEKERGSWITSSKISVIDSFLPLLDELELALTQSKAQELSDEVTSWLDGFKLVQKNMKKKLADLGVTEIAGSGEFDPKKHEALMRVASDEVASGHIVAVLVPGYQLGDEVIRHAKVSVAE